MVRIRWLDSHFQQRQGTVNKGQNITVRSQPSANPFYVLMTLAVCWDCQLYGNNVTNNKLASMRIASVGLDRHPPPTP